MVKVSEDYHITRLGRYRRNPKRIGGSEYLTIQRVPYNPEDIGETGRDYWQNGPPAMSLEDWKIYAKKMRYLGLRIFENGNARIELI